MRHFFNEPMVGPFLPGYNAVPAALFTIFSG
jgi:hypothetical protein